jgi:hypothetical protein
MPSQQILTLSAGADRAAAGGFDECEVMIFTVNATPTGTSKLLTYS